MKAPYQSLWMYLVAQNNWPMGVWRYNVKWTGSAFYIGTDDDHVTVMEGTDGFHHSYNEGGQHVTGPQHLSATTVQLIIDHVNANPQSYPDPTILNTLVYLRDHM